MDLLTTVDYCNFVISLLIKMLILIRLYQRSKHITTKGTMSIALYENNNITYLKTNTFLWFTSTQDLVEARGNPCHIRPEEYFDETVPLINRDIGRPRESASRVQRFKATLWLCDTYPLSLAEQVTGLPFFKQIFKKQGNLKRQRHFRSYLCIANFELQITSLNR